MQFLKTEIYFEINKKNSDKSADKSVIIFTVIKKKIKNQMLELQTIQDMCATSHLQREQ